MKFFSGKKGFTIVELIIALNLLGVVGLATGSYISDSFKHSNQLSNKAAVQSSVTALMNDLKTAIKTANIPALEINLENSNEKEYTINQLSNGNIIELNIKFNKNSRIVTINNQNTYELIQDITLEKVTGDNGAKIKIIGADSQYILSSTYYTRNTTTGCVHKWNEIESTISTCTTNGEKKYECINCGITKIDQLPLLDHIFSNWLNSDTHHWKKCIECNKEIDKGLHLIKNNKCVVCSYIVKNTEDNESHTHNWIDIEVVKEATCTEKGQVKYTCNCGATKTEETAAKGHLMNWARSPINHVYSCEVCGYHRGAEEHTFNYSRNETNHYWACIECGYIKSSEEHTMGWARSETSHYYACEECGYIKNYGVHIFNYAESGTTHYYACEDCGYIVYSKPHNYKYAGSDIKHYWACEDCGYPANNGEHVYDWGINSDNHYYACKTCGYIKNSAEQHEYSWAVNENSHYEACTTCGYIKNEQAHNYKDGKCTTCGYKK